MSEQATMDEAAATALLLDQHIHAKVMHALADMLFADTDKARVFRALEQGSDTAYVAHVFTRTLILNLVRDDTFQQNLRYQVNELVRTEVARVMMQNRPTSVSMGLYDPTQSTKTAG